MKKAISVMIVSIVLASGSGFFLASALGQDGSGRTVTVTLRNGERGPVGPPGPKGEKGDSGTFVCPNGFIKGNVLINHPGGQVTIYGCVKEG